MKYAIEIGSGSMTCIPSLREIGSDILKLIVGENTNTQTA
jgi:hypothetical protein